MKNNLKNSPSAVPGEPLKLGVFKEKSSGNFHNFGLLTSSEV